jgi:Flp pilus assembly protein TadG
MKLRSARKATRGAVLAEFVIAIVPLLTAFFSFLQLGKMYTANIVQKHAAKAAARAATVYCGENNPAGEYLDDATRLAAIAAFGKVYGAAFKDIKVTTKMREPSDPHGLLTTSVTATYDCNIPLGKAICLGGSRTRTEEVTLPCESADFQCEDETCVP